MPDLARIYLAVGHGHRDDGTFDPGAVGGGWDEQRAGDHIVAEAAAVLRAAGLTVNDEAFTRDPNFPGTARDANAWRADVVVSVHHDWIGAPVGAFGHWLTSAGKEVADAIQEAVGQAGYTLRPDWHKRRTDLSLLRNTAAPAVIYEVGRIGQADLDTVDELKAMGRAIAAGIAQWAGVDIDPHPEDPMADYGEELQQIVTNTRQTADDAQRQVRLSAALVEAEVAHIRAGLGLDPDPASDGIWSSRIATGSHTLEDVKERLTSLGRA